MRTPIHRTRFGEIVAEFALPIRPSKNVVILCSGVPGNPSRAALLDFFSRKGFWCFAPRYRGSWESGGKFLAMSPEKDIKDVIDGISNGFKDAYSGKKYKMKPLELHLFGSSFGGAAALLLSKDPRVTKVVALSPVVDWRVASKKEPMKPFENFLRAAFGEAYRFSHRDWAKLTKGNFYNPAIELKKIDGKKILIVHAKDDDVVSFAPVARFSKVTGAKMFALRRGGHGGVLFATKPGNWKKIKNFLRSRN